MSPDYHGYFAILFVEDIDVARNFYENVVGFTLDKGDERSAGFFTGEDFLQLLNHDGATEMLGAERVNTGKSVGAKQVLVAPVDDVETAFAELQSRGVDFLGPLEDRSWGVRCAYFKDPDDNVWELH
jgi:catechol 2,3-dioxygenase-like lactoylglutathione lyase family enzyme